MIEDYKMVLPLLLSYKNFVEDKFDRKKVHASLHLFF